ncbi:hypothetical protein PRIPAC_83005 [Pristionchus pacificus]|uniref:Uncharacterized protein n=1 Tax=Pristionchus pacificus TaxID=54126 RepID=A0A2A6CKP3_PRIPA|nr:hypothetical protein PRIPAC_83005 [Pristionchus pacificus]|eukprot:PDM78658.1 hypothetical protein PRIPAC_31237 [Pristionchus pacificus]
MYSWCYNFVRIYSTFAVAILLMEHYQRYYSTCRSPYSAAPTNTTEPALPCERSHPRITAFFSVLDYILYLFVVAHVALAYVLALIFSLPWVAKQTSCVESRFMKTRIGKTRKANGRKRSIRRGSEFQTTGDISSN